MHVAQASGMLVPRPCLTGRPTDAYVAPAGRRPSNLHTGAPLPPAPHSRSRKIADSTVASPVSALQRPPVSPEARPPSDPAVAHPGPSADPRGVQKPALIMAARLALLLLLAAAAAAVRADVQPVGWWAVVLPAGSSTAGLLLPA